MYFWWQQARWPLVLFAFVATVLATTTIDVTFARWAFFDVTRLQWRGADSWWINTLIHEDGRWLVRLIVATALFGWTATFFNERYLVWRRPAGYFVLAVILTVGAVGLLKVTTNVDCAWDLAPFGGRFPYVHLFADRPDALPQARCFPAAHASSGYALMVFYFLFRERSRRLARMGLAAGIVLGLIFGVAQQSRGAHLLSHDVWSAVLAWLIPLSLYAFAFKCRLWGRPRAMEITVVKATTAAWDQAWSAGRDR
jgi:membrane-associated PAP2 superfamily phosphatase